jgi:Mce-associated membrane protein
VRITRTTHREPAGAEADATRPAATGSAGPGADTGIATPATGTGTAPGGGRTESGVPGPRSAHPERRAAPSPRSPGIARLIESRGLLVLFAVSLVLTLAGAGLVVAGAQVRASPVAANRALTDPAATRQVIGVIGADLTRIFSYSYADLPATQRAARQVLAGAAAAQYDTLFPQLRNAVGQRLSLATRVVQAGVTQLSASTAHLLVFMDQTAARGQAQIGTATYHAQLAITAQFRAGRWRITSIEAR